MRRAEVIIGVIVFLFCVLYLEVAEAYEIKNPALVKDIKVLINMSGRIGVEGKPSNISINLTIPQDNDRQDVKTSIKIIETEEGRIGVIESKMSSNVFSYTVGFEVSARDWHTSELELPSSIPDYALKYLKGTENIQSNAEIIRKLAKEITANAGDDFEKVAKLAIWVNNNIRYDLACSDKNYDALWVLKNKRGVCAEYTTLFTALARSIGIPTKYISGYAFGDEGWERHAYAEVWLGKWVPVDILWLEVGYIDATHIKFGEHLDNQANNNVRVSGLEVGNIAWEEDRPNISIIDYELRDRSNEYRLGLSTERAFPGDDVLVIMDLTPKEYAVERLELKPCKGYNIVSVDNETKTLILKKGERSVIYWKLHVNESLPKGYIFTCPLTLNSRLFSLRSINLSVVTGKEKAGGNIKNVFVSSLNVSLGKSIDIWIETNRKSGKIGFIADGIHEVKDASREGISFSFIPKKAGKGKIVIYSSYGEVREFEYVSDRQHKKIKDISIKRHAVVGEKLLLSVELSGSGKVVVKSENVELEGRASNNKTNFTLYYNSTGIKQITVSVVENGKEMEREKIFVEVYDLPLIAIDSFYINKKAVIRIKVERYEARDVEIFFDGKRKTLGSFLGEKIVKFDAEEGTHVIKVLYKDEGGKEHEIIRHYTFNESLIDKLINFIKYILNKIKAIFSYFFP